MGGVEPALVPANAGDHGLVRDFLRFLQGGPSSEDFGNWLDEPSYEPTDRLLIKWGERLAGHVHLLHRVAFFDGVSVPVACLVDFAAMPELHDTPWERTLLAAAERAAGDGHAVLAMSRTNRPALFVANGWLPARGQGHSRADTRKILSQLADELQLSLLQPLPLEVRLWRHLELEALCAAYKALTVCRWGSLERSESYWRWLVGRKVHDALMICVEGTAPLSNEADASRFVGCAVTRGSQVLEIFYRPTHPLAGKMLLARACRDAIDQGFHHVSLEAPVEEPVHKFLFQAEGQWHPENAAIGETLMIKLLEPQRWIDTMYPAFEQRAAAADLPRPFSIRFDDGRQQHRFTLNRQSSRLTKSKYDEADIRCTPETLHALLLGNMDFEEGLATGVIAAEVQVGRSLRAMFPPRMFSTSPLDVRRY